MSWADKLTSRKFWAFLVGVVAAFVYAFGLINEQGLAAITASVAAYNIGEGLADFGQGKATVEASAHAYQLERRNELGVRV